MHSDNDQRRLKCNKEKRTEVLLGDERSTVSCKSVKSYRCSFRTGFIGTQVRQT